VIRTDVFRRGVPWMLLIKRSGTIETDLNVKPTERLCVALTGVVLLAMLVLPWNSLGAAVAGLGSAGVVWLNRDFYRFLGRCKGPVFAAASLPLHLLYYTCCGVSVVIALFQWHVLSRVTASRLSGATRHNRVDRGVKPIPRPILARIAGRLARWTSRSK
jgi:hypothetical protein